MLERPCYDAPGIGLAAIQVGEPLRMLVLDVSKDEDAKTPQVFVNPEIVASSDAPNVHEEGCLSIPRLLCRGRTAVRGDKYPLCRNSTGRNTRSRRGTPAWPGQLRLQARKSTILNGVPLHRPTNLAV